MKLIALLVTFGLVSCLLVHAAPTVQPSCLPFTFEPNRGQSDHQVRYIGRASGAAIWFTDSAVVLSPARSATIRLKFAGGNPRPQIEGTSPTGGRSNYFPADSSRWHTNIPQFERVRYTRVYPGIDLLFYGNSSTLEYDWIVQPGADPRSIRMSVEGASSVEIAPEGDLVMKVANVEIRARKPHLYQQDREVEGRFVRRGNDFGFEVASYDTHKELTIDPVLTYATYIGGSNLSFGVGGNSATNLTFQDNAYGVAADSTGNVIIVGGTYSSDFPVQRGYDTAQNNGWSAFVMKVNPKAATTAQFIVWSTFLGGANNTSVSSEAQSQAVAVDKQGNVYVTGYEAGAFPTMNAFQSTTGGGTCAAGSACHDAFVSKLSSDGTTLIYSSYLGGNQDDYGYAIAVDGSGDAFVGGQTKSGNFPVNRAYQGTIVGTSSGFVTEVNPAGNQTIVSSFFGGDKDQLIDGVAADTSGNIYVTGPTSSAKFPTMNAFQTAASGSASDGFAAEFNASPAGLKLLYSTYLGGPGGATSLAAIALDTQNDIVVTGGTASPNYPVSSPAFSSKLTATNGNAVVTKLKPSAAGKAQLVYSTYLGGTGSDAASAIAIDSSGRYAVGGATYSSDFPVTPDGFQFYYFGKPGTTLKSFVAVLDPTQTKPLVYGTYFGGEVSDNLTALTLDGTGIDFVGLAFSPDDYTAPNAFQTTLNKFSKIFLGRIDMSQTGPIIAGVTNAANFATVTGFVPGEIITFFGSNLGPAQIQYSTVDATGHFGNTIAGCQVIINGIAAPMIYASANQTSAITPYEVAPNITNAQTAYARVFCNGTGSNTWYTAAVAATPGIFAANDGTTQGAILNQDGSPNSSSNPAPQGSVIVFFATGEGTLTPAGQDGRVETGPANTLPMPSQTVAVTFGGVAAASIPYAGVAPQSVDGLLQVNAQIPLTSPTGNVPLVLQVGSGKSQSNLTVAVSAAAR